MLRVSFTLLTILLASVQAEETICSQCKCEQTSTNFKLNCSRKKLSKIPEEWPELSRNSTVISASFSGNSLPALNERFPPSNATIDLILTKCGIETLTNGLFENIINVRFVDLSYNLITGKELKYAFVGPANNTQVATLAIEDLNLSNNKIHSLGKKVFKHMPQLRTLNLAGNHFRVLDLQTQASFTSLKNLQRLNLGNNELTEIVATALQPLDNLSELNLSNNLLNFVPLSLGIVGKTLRVLILDNNPIVEMIDDSFVGLEELIEISANNLSRLKFVNANTFAHLNKLQKLSLCDNVQLTEIDREAFAVNFSLKEFYLSNSSLYKLDFSLLHWSSLKVFEFKNNPLECSCNLFNITKNLNPEITRNENGPFCFNPSNDQSEQVFYLKSDICSVVGRKRSSSLSKTMRGYTHLSIGLTGLILVLIFASALAMHVGFIKYRIRSRNKSNIAPSMGYNPVQNQF